MSSTIVRLLVFVVFQGTMGFGTPNHCLCYKWEGLVRTDCVKKNLFNTFVGFPHQTQVLDLSHNVISILHGNEFLDANLRQLQDLRLSNNRLHIIDKLSFNGLQFLENVDLSFNSIEHLNPSTFKYNPYLKILNVSFNPLSLKKDEPFLSPASNLRILDMTNCRLQFVSLQSFLDLKDLRVLNISQNYIKKIEVEFLNKMKSLRYLDVSKNAIPCNDQTKALLQFLEQGKIQFQAFCLINQKMMLPVLEANERKNLEIEVSQKSYNGYNENVVKRDTEKTFLNEIIKFFQSIPPFYAVVCGMQVGIFIGSLSTYFCLRKSVRNYKRSTDQEAAAELTSYANENSQNMSFALVHLNTPPGTPPSPYYSRFFSSNFSFSAT